MSAKTSREVRTRWKCVQRGSPAQGIRLSQFNCPSCLPRTLGPAHTRRSARGVWGTRPKSVYSPAPKGWSHCVASPGPHLGLQRNVTSLLAQGSRQCSLPYLLTYNARTRPSSRRCASRRTPSSRASASQKIAAFSAGTTRSARRSSLSGELS